MAGVESYQYSPLFMALAQSKGMPSHAYRAFESAAEIPGEAFSGYMQGLQARRMMQQPAALQRLYSAIGGPNADQLGPEAFYGMDPKDILTYGASANRLGAQRAIAMANLAERGEEAGQRSKDYQTRTQLMETMFGGHNLTQNIMNHENEIDRLTTVNASLAKQLPGDLQSSLWKGAANLMGIAPPQYKQVLGQMAGNEHMINQHSQMLNGLYKVQGMVPQSILNEPPPTGASASQPTDNINDGGDDWLQVH